jgi:hypothetical protein
MSLTQPNVITDCNLLITIRKLIQHGRAASRHVLTATAHAHSAALRPTGHAGHVLHEQTTRLFWRAVLTAYLTSNGTVAQPGSGHPTNPETIRILVVCIAVLLAILVGIAAALLWRSDARGRSIAGAILKGGAVFAGTLTVLILVTTAMGFT